MVITLPMVQRAVADHFQIRMELLKTRGSYKTLNHCRTVAMYVARTMTSESLPTIGKAFSRDHSSVAAAVKRIEAQLETDAGLRASIELIRVSLVGEAPSPETSADATQCPMCGHSVRKAMDEARALTAFEMAQAAIAEGLKAMGRS